MIQTVFLDREISYTGQQLHSLWIRRTCGLSGDSLVAFLGPCSVSVEHLVDMEDRAANAPIFSRLMLHFIAEHFDRDLEKAVLRQRLLVALAAELLNRDRQGPAVVRRGDDIYVDSRKLSVSIATLSPMSALIHFGLNVISDGAPVPAIGLRELNVAPEPFARQVLAAYVEELSGVDHARTKVRGVG
jgi:hypothetical protein